MKVIITLNMPEKLNLKNHEDRINLGTLATKLLTKESFDDFLVFKEKILSELKEDNSFYSKVKSSHSLIHFEKIINRFDDADKFNINTGTTSEELIKNRVLLKEILRSAKMSKRECSDLLWDHCNSLDGYLLKFSGKVFPQSFAYFFLNSIFFHTEISFRAKKDRASKDPQKFEELIKDALDIGIEEKLILPALEHHISMIIKSSITIPKSKENFEPESTLKADELKEIKNILNKGDQLRLYEIDMLINKYREHPVFWFYAKKNPVINSFGIAEENKIKSPEGRNLKKDQNIASYNEEYLNNILSDREEYLAVRGEYTLSPESEDAVAKAISLKKKFNHFDKLNSSIKSFKVFLEKMRKLHLKNFIIPNEIANIDDDGNQGIIFTKKFLKSYSLNNKHLVLHEIEGELDGCLNKKDLVLIEKFPSWSEPHIGSLSNGLYALRRGNKIFVRNLEFFPPMVNILSNNDKKPMQIDYGKFISNGWLFGKVIFSISNHSKDDFQIPEFLRNNYNQEYLNRWEKIYEDIPQEESKKIA